MTTDRFLCTRTRGAKPVLKASKGHFCGFLLQAKYIYAAAYNNGDRGIIIIIHVHQEATFEKRDNAHPPGRLVGWFGDSAKKVPKNRGFFADKSLGYPSG